MPRPPKRPQASKPFDALSKGERDKWRSLDETRAFRQQIRAEIGLAYQNLAALAEKNRPAGNVAGLIRGLELVEQKMLSNPEDPRSQEGDDFRDPAMPPAYIGWKEIT